MNPIGVDHVRRLAGEHGIPGAVAEELHARLRPCIYLVSHAQLSRKDDARPAGRTGGLPSLPQGVEWPDGAEPLVLTVDCAALPHDVLDIELPPEGSLLFFTDLSYPPESSAVLHVPAGVDATERPATCDIGGETLPIRVHDPHTLYAVAGLTIAHDWDSAPESSAYLDDGPGGEEALRDFVDAVLDSVHDGKRPAVCVQIGGYSASWDMPPDEGDLTLLAQIAGQAVDYEAFVLNLIVGTREDIAARRYDRLQYDQQC